MSARVGRVGRLGPVKDGVGGRMDPKGEGEGEVFVS